MKMRQLLLMVLCLAVVLGPVVAGASDQGTGAKKPDGLARTNGEPVSGLININNIASWIRNDGKSANIPSNGNSGLFFPRGTGAAVFEDGIVWGGYVQDGGDPVLRVGGQTYNIGTVGGRIISPGVADNPNNANVRLYRFRRDYATADLKQEAAEFFLKALSAVTDADTKQLRDQYAKDEAEWPASEGAPYYDNNTNGVYDAGVDEPGFAGADQVVWFVCNDINPGPVAQLYGSPPIGYELQVTLWGYARSDALGNAIFKRFRVIYKGTATTPANATIDSLFLSQWSDIDLGDAGDDFAGCDINLSTGFVYNGDAEDGVYANFGLAPPASGYDFLAGPAVAAGPDDEAIIDLKKVKGKKNLPMTSFIYFAAGSAISDPDFNYNGTLQWYNLLNGYQPRPFVGPPVPYFDANNNPVTPFALRGDPVTGIGDIDGKLIGPSDRRIALSSGPFTMALGDTQEVVVGVLCGLGNSRLSSLSVFKFNDLTVQSTYNNLFQVPKPPRSPALVATPFDGKVLLDWGSVADQVAETEGQNDVGYQFEGYNVYQLPSAAASLSQAAKLATFDLNNLVGTILDPSFDLASGVILQTPSQIGTNSGLKRFTEITTDAFRGGRPLVNGQTYYFAVTAYNANLDPAATPHALESALLVQSVIPQGPKPGVRYASDATLTVEHTGISDGAVEAIVVNPALMNGHDYKVTFVPDTVQVGNYFWSLIDVTASNAVVLADQTNQSGDDNYLVTSGVQVKVVGPPPGMKDWDIPSGTRRFTFAGGAAGLEFEGFEGAIGWASPASVFGSGVPGVAAPFIKNVVLRLATVDVTGNYDPADPNVSYGYRYGRSFANAPAKPEFAPFIINPVGGYSYQDFTKSVPLAAFDTEVDPPRRLAVGHLENNQPGGLVDGKWWPPDFNVGDNTAGPGPREWLWIFNTDYSETPDPAYQVEAIGTALPIMYFLTVARRGNVPFSPGGTGEDEFLILANHVNSEADVFTFKSKAPSSSASVAQQDVEKVRVFPNPYLGFNRAETSINSKFVTFSHLPTKATLRIFDLAGTLVRKLEKDDSAQFLRWDLLNQNGLPAASGIYIVHVDMPAPVGKTKTMKLMIIQEVQQLRYY